MAFQSFDVFVWMKNGLLFKTSMLDCGWMHAVISAHRIFVSKPFEYVVFELVIVHPEMKILLSFVPNLYDLI